MMSLPADRVRHFACLKRSSMANTYRRSLYFIFVLLPIAVAGPGCRSFNACDRISGDQNNNRGIFGCYVLVKETGGIRGGIYEVNDRETYIILTPDSLFNSYQKEELLSSMPFTVKWDTSDPRFQKSAEIKTSDPMNLVQWTNDTLFTGMPGGIPDASGAVYAKCR
jgi:hypothetical protein